MDVTSIGMETNAVNHFFGQVGNFWKHCSDGGFPLFFEQPPISDSTAVILKTLIKCNNLKIFKTIFVAMASLTFLSSAAPARFLKKIAKTPKQVANFTFPDDAPF